MRNFKSNSARHFFDKSANKCQFGDQFVSKGIMLFNSFAVIIGELSLKLRDDKCFSILKLKKSIVKETIFQFLPIRIVFRFVIYPRLSRVDRENIMLNKIVLHLRSFERASWAQFTSLMSLCMLSTQRKLTDRKEITAHNYRIHVKKRSGQIVVLSSVFQFHTDMQIIQGTSIISLTMGSLCSIAQG